MSDSVKGGETNVITYFQLRNKADGTDATGKTIADFDLTYTRSGAVAAAKVDAIALGGAGDAHADNKMIEVDAADAPGFYRVDWPDAAFAAGVRTVNLTVKHTDIQTATLRMMIDPVSNLVKIDGQATDGNNADLKLKSLSIVRPSGGPALQVTATGEGEDGAVFTGDDDGAGMVINGGNNAAGAGGNGLVLQGGSGGTGGDGGHGLIATAGAKNGAGTDGNAVDLNGTGAGAGLTIDGGTTGAAAVLNGGSGSGDGLKVTATDGDAISSTGGTNGSGLVAKGAGTGSGIVAQSGTGATGQGILAQALSTNGDGVRSAGTGTANGVYSTGGATSGHGILAESGAGANGDAVRFEAKSTDGHGLNTAGNGSGAGIRVQSPDAGHGVHITSGSGGDGILTVGGTNGHGINSKGVGTGSGIVAESGTGATGDGFKAESKATNGNGLKLIGIGTGQDIEAGEIGVPVAIDGGGASLADNLKKIVDDSGGTSFDATTDSLEAIRNRGDAAWSSLSAVDWTAAERNQIRHRLNIDGTQAAPTAGGAAKLAGTDAALTLKSIAVVNSGGDAVKYESTGSNGTGLRANGNGTGCGIRGFSAGTGCGISADATSGDGILATGGTNGAGLKTTGAGTGSGIVAQSGGGATGQGILAQALSTNGDGFNAVGTGTGHGAELSAGGGGNGLKAASTTGEGMVASGGTNQDGFRAVGNGTGHGMCALSGAGATGNGILAQSQATNGHGLRALGIGTGNGILTESGAGATGDGIKSEAKSTNGNGFQLIGTGTGRDIKADEVKIMFSGTAAAASASTLTFPASGSAIDDFYNKTLIEIVAGLGVGQARQISGYVGATKVATVTSNWVTTPDVTSKFQAIAASDTSATASISASDGLAFSNQRRKKVAYDANGNPTSYELHIFNNATDAANDANVAKKFSAVQTYARDTVNQNRFQLISSIMKEI